MLNLGRFDQSLEKEMINLKYVCTYVTNIKQYVKIFNPLHNRKFLPCKGWYMLGVKTMQCAVIDIETGWTKSNQFSFLRVL